MPAVGPDKKSGRRIAFLRRCLVAIGLGLALAFVIEAGRVLVFSNFHVVVPGSVYRCAQPSKHELERLIEKLGIRTVMNLRGSSAPQDWYMRECRATSKQDIAQEDICLSAGRLPPVSELRHLIDVLDHTEYPILLHCKRGADRTGMTSALVMLLYTDVSLAIGQRQLGLRYGHVALGRPANLNRFFHLYEQWLDEHGQVHSPALLRHWIQEEYTAGPCSASLEIIRRPQEVYCGEPVVWMVRARNTSVETWHFRAGANAGIHLSYGVHNESGHCFDFDRAGLFDADVPPGESIDLTLAVFAPMEPGHYRLHIDLIDEQQGNFYMAGSEPLEEEFDVAEQVSAPGSKRGSVGFPGLADRLGPRR